MAQVNLGRVVGYSAYEIAVQEGFVGTEAEWLASLKGDTGNTGPAGADGDDGTTFTPSVSGEGVISWTNDGGKTNPSPVNIKGPTGATGATGPAGADGSDGEDGFSPIATVARTQDDDGAVITITDATGTTTATVYDGSDADLPAISSGDAGKVLKVNSLETGVEWATDSTGSYTAGTGINIAGGEISVDTTTVAMKSDIPAAELPAIASGDAGKVLSVNSLETGVEWATPSSGTSIRVIDVGSTADGYQFYPTADELAYLTNTLKYGWDAYPVVIKGNNYRQWNFSNASSAGIFFYSPSQNTNCAVALNSSKEALFINVGTTSGQLTADKIPLPASYSPSGELTNVRSAFQYIKNNYAKTTDIPSYTAGAGININNGVISAIKPNYLVNSANYSSSLWNDLATLLNNDNLVYIKYEGKISQPAMGPFNGFNLDYNKTAAAEQVNLSSIDLSSIDGALANARETYGDNWLMLAVINNDEENAWYFNIEDYNEQDDSFTKDWLTIDLDDDTITTDGETLTSLLLVVKVPQSFISANIFDCWVNGNESVMSGTNIQLYEGGDVNVYNPMISQEEGSDIPTLRQFKIGDTVSGDVLELGDVNYEGEEVEGVYIYNITDASLLDNLEANNGYTFEYALSDSSGGTQNGEFSWFSEEGTGWIYNSQGTGPLSKIIVMVDSQASTSPSLIRLVIDPNWAPSEAYINEVVVNSPLGTQVYSANNLEVYKNSNDVYHIGGGPGVSPLHFSADLVDGNTCSITISWSDGGMDSCSETLAYSTGSGPNRYAMTNSGQGQINQVWFLPQGNAGEQLYDIDIWLRSNNQA